MNSYTIISVNGKRKIFIENIANGDDKRKEAVDLILKNKLK